MSQTQLVRYRHGKLTFEVMTNLGSVQKYRDQKLGLDNVLQADVVWTNQSKGERAKGSELKEAFNTEDTMECIRVILAKGEIQLTAAERREQTEQKRREIVYYVHKYYTDPRAKTPHPIARIDSALTEIKFRVDPDVPAERQAQDALKKLVEVIPLKRSEIVGTLSVPIKVLGAVQGILSKGVDVAGETYTGDSCEMTISVVPGDYDHLMAELNKATKGEFQFEIEGAAAAAATTEDSPTKKGGKGKKK